MYKLLVLIFASSFMCYPSPVLLTADCKKPCTRANESVATENWEW